MGAANPVAPKTTVASRAKNRRTEITLSLVGAVARPPARAYYFVRWHSHDPARSPPTHWLQSRRSTSRWMGYLLFKQRLGVVPIQRLLLALGVCMLVGMAGNLVITLRSLFGLEVARWDPVLRFANTIAVISITVCYSLLLHVHIHLWATAQSRELTRLSASEFIFRTFHVCFS